MAVISVIIPVYNSAETIREAIESVRIQDFTDYEIVVVNDKSSDNTLQVVESALIGVNQRIKVLSLSANSGPAAARNRGIAEAQGEWIAFLDADDVWLPCKLEMQMEYVKQNPGIAMVCGGTLPFKDGSLVVSPSRATEEEWLVGSLALPADMSADVLSGRASVPASRSLPPDSCRLSLDDFVTANPVATSTVVVRKDVVLSVGGFDEQFRGPEDYDLWMRIVANNAVTYFDMPFGRYRRVAGSLSMNEKAFLPQVIRVIDKAFGEKGVFAGRPGKRKAIAHQVLAASWTAADRDELVRAWVLWLKSLIVWPFSFGSGERLSWVRTRLAFRFLKCALRGNECS